jgi:hypothetical protein
MAHWTTPAGQVRALAKAVADAFAASNLTLEEKNPGKIEVSDLPWQAPPLLAPQLLNGAPLQDYLDTPLNLKTEDLLRFWKATDEMMWSTPGRLLNRGALAPCGKFMPKVKVGQRALRFSVPSGYPAYLEETTGLILALEVAHTAVTSLPVARVVSDDDNYYAEIDGQILGVKAGRPAIDSAWRQPYPGMVQEFLSMPRGDAKTDCAYDQIASLRSVLHMHRKSFPRNFDAIDLALQSLRLLTMGSYCPELVQSMYVAPIDAARQREVERTYRDSIETMRDKSLSDRVKLQVLHSLLVPSPLSAGKFKQHIFSGSPYPFTLAKGKAEQIEAWLLQEYNTRIPAEMRQLKETT